MPSVQLFVRQLKNNLKKIGKLFGNLYFEHYLWRLKEDVIKSFQQQAAYVAATWRLSPHKATGFKYTKTFTIHNL